MNDMNKLLAYEGPAYYAIRHKPTGRFMPETHGKYSYWSPEDTNDAHPPRLFVNRRSAANALTAWLQGTWSQVTELESDDWHSYSVTVGAQPTAVFGRCAREQMEVVELGLIETDHYTKE